jgi:hypothetical protein
MNWGTALVGVFTDPTYGIPLTIAIGLTVGVGWWARVRAAPLPSMDPNPPPAVWRLQLDALVYANLSEGRYSAAVDGLGRCLAVAIRDRFRVPLAEVRGMDTEPVDRVLPRQLTLQGLFKDLNRAYTSAAWAEQPGWLAARWGWLSRRQQRRAARDFAVLTKGVTSALDAFEAE